MALELLPVTEADIPRINDIIFQSFESDPLHVLAFPREHASSYNEFMHEFLRSKLPDPNVKSLKVVDPNLSGDASIVGYTRWIFPSGENQQTPSKETTKTSTTAPFPAQANKQIWDFLGEQTKQVRAQFVDPARDYVLEFLATDPQHQGRGIGKIMLKYGLDELDRRGNGAKAFLEATPFAIPIYKKYGFEPLGSIDVPLAEFGVGDTGLYQCIVMGRDAQ